jgi:hypothetical protein
MNKKTSDQLLLTDEEVLLLRKGLMEWSGPARCTEEFAVAMGFAGTSELPACCSAIRDALASGEPLESIDWARALLATEIAFSSDVVGSGYEWSTTTGLPDDVTVRILRSVQRKLVHTVAPLVGNKLGTRTLGFWPLTSRHASFCEVRPIIDNLSYSYACLIGRRARLAVRVAVMAAVTKS